MKELNMNEIHNRNYKIVVNESNIVINNEKDYQLVKLDASDIKTSDDILKQLVLEIEMIIKFINTDDKIFFENFNRKQKNYIKTIYLEELESLLIDI